MRNGYTLHGHGLTDEKSCRAEKPLTSDKSFSEYCEILKSIFHKICIQTLKINYVVCYLATLDHYKLKAAA